MEFSGAKSTTLREVNLDVISLAKCNVSYGYVSTNNICTYTRGKDACQVKR